MTRGFHLRFRNRRRAGGGTTRRAAAARRQRPLSTVARAIFFAFFSLIWSAGFAQDASSTPTIAPKLFGFDIPNGPLRAGGAVVVVRDDHGKEQIAKMHVGVGDRVILMMPDGRLIARRREETRSTQQPFQGEDVAALGQRLTSGPFKGFKTHATRRYLFIYNTTDNFALVASRVLESMFPGVMTYAEALGIEVHEPDAPLVVVMFRDEQEYRRMTRAPAGMLAFYNVVDNRVSMYESSDFSRPNLAVQQTLATIAHEGAHQILHNIGVQQRLSAWPMWITEGMAEFFAPTATDNRLRWKGAGQVNDLRMFELEQYFKTRPVDDDGKLIADGKLIEDAIVAARLTSTGYAASWALTHYLAKNRRADFHRYVKQLSRLGPLEGDLRIVRPGVVPGNREMFQTHFGNDYSTMEKRIVAHLKRQEYNDPFAAMPHFVAQVSVTIGNRSRRNANIFRTEEMAKSWQQEALAALPENLRKSAKLSVVRARNKLAAQELAVQWLRGG